MHTIRDRMLLANARTPRLVLRCRAYSSQARRRHTARAASVLPLTDPAGEIVYPPARAERASTTVEC